MSSQITAMGSMLSTMPAVMVIASAITVVYAAACHIVSSPRFTRTAGLYDIVGNIKLYVLNSKNVSFYWLQPLVYGNCKPCH